MAIEKITEEINQGNTHPRLFEVFGQLQDKLTMVVKTQANYFYQMSAIEVTKLATYSGHKDCPISILVQ